MALGGDPNGCAMIFLGTGQCAGLLLLSRVAGRRTLMMGINRSNLSCRTLLILIALIGTLIPARSATLEDSAKELARRISSAFPVRDVVSLKIGNISSLQPDEIARIDQALRSELQDRGIHTSASGSANVSIFVTLSESLKDFIWGAQIHQGDSSKVVLITVPRAFVNQTDPARMPIVLQFEKFWEGPDRILDGGLIPGPTGIRWRVLLLPDGVEINELGNNAVTHVAVPSAQPFTREPRGSLALVGNAVIAALEPHVCTVSLETRTLGECHSSDAPASARDPIELLPLARLNPEKMGQAVLTRNQCGKDQQFLATGAGDDTQPDSIQVFESQGSRTFPVSDPVYFAGPVIALHSAGYIPTAIVRNLKTGHYEAYRLSLSCSQ